MHIFFTLCYFASIFFTPYFFPLNYIEGSLLPFPSLSFYCL